MLNKHNLDVAKFASKEESRYTMNAILVTPHETVATDGHRLVRVSLPKREDFPSRNGFEALETWTPFLLPVKTAQNVAKAIPQRQTIPALEMVGIGKPQGEDETTCELVVTDLEEWRTFAVRKLTGTFPKWSQVIPQGEFAFEITVDASYLAEMAAAASKFTDAPTSSLTIRFRADHCDKAIRMDARRSDGQTWVGVLMPVRDAVPLADLDTVPAPQPETVPQPEAESKEAHNDDLAAE